STLAAANARSQRLVEDPLSERNSQPYGQKANQVRQPNVARDRLPGADLDEAQRFVFVRRKRGVGADEADRQEVAPRVVFPVGEKGQEQTDDEAAGDIDEERAVRPGDAEALGEQRTDAEARDRAERAAERDEKDVAHARMVA